MADSVSYVMSNPQSVFFFVTAQKKKDFLREIRGAEFSCQNRWSDLSSMSSKKGCSDKLERLLNEGA